jgi:signal transduction histidine kinase
MSVQGAPAILIVEDERIVARDLQQTLIEMGYDAYAIANSCKEAIARASLKCPDIVLMDIRIEGEHDGIETAAILRSDFDAGVVYLTAHADESIIERAKKTEPYGYVLKPVETAELGRVLSIAVYKHAMEKARERTAQLELQVRGLQDAQRLKDHFLATMSHELRTPLNGIIGFSQILMYGGRGALNDYQRECVTRVLECGQDMLRLVNDVLDLSRIEANKLQLQSETFSLAEAIEEVCTLVSLLADKKNIGIHRTISAAIEQVTLDRQRLMQVLYNLLSNAIKFTGEGGEIHISAEPQGCSSLRLRVRDTGIGIRSEDMEKLFCNFSQLDSGSTRHYGGVGLGLALTKKLVEAQCGTITVESDPGQGSTFTVILPCAITAPLATGAGST